MSSQSCHFSFITVHFEVDLCFSLSFDHLLCSFAQIGNHHFENINIFLFDHRAGTNFRILGSYFANYQNLCFLYFASTFG